MSEKRAGRKQIDETLDADKDWSVKAGRVVRRNPGKVATGNLFKFVGEKIPFWAIRKVEKYVSTKLGGQPNGVYLAIDSMGCPRYAGRGAVFSRLKAHKKLYPFELTYFSFYIVKKKQHERELETLLIRSTSFLAVLNKRKVRASIEPGNMLDYEVGTSFIERQYKKGKKTS